MKKTIIALLLVACCISACFVGGTFAKYTSVATGTATAQVAKWNIQFNGTDMAVQNPTVSFNLFDTINDTGNTADETNVADNKIAPGTAGAFTLTVKNASEVDAEFAINFEVTGAADVSFLKFKVNDGEWGTLADVATQEITMGTQEDFAIQWKWDYSVDTAADSADTLLGIAAPTITVTATITVTQVD